MKAQEEVNGCGGGGHAGGWRKKEDVRRSQMKINGPVC